MTKTKVTQTGFLICKSQKADATQTLALTTECVRIKARINSNVTAPDLSKEINARKVQRFVREVDVGVVNVC